MSRYVLTSPNVPPTLPAKSVSPVNSVDLNRKHDEPSVWPGVCSMRIAAPSPKGSSSPSTIGNARLASDPIAAESERCITICASGKAREISAVASQWSACLCVIRMYRNA